MDFNHRQDRSMREIEYHDWNRQNRDRLSEDQLEKLLMLRPLRATCKSCTMCRLGRMQHEHDNKLEECHVFSNMNPSRYMVVAQNPGYNECIGDEPLIGDSGEIFDEIIERNGLSRSTFYITNVVKCYSPSNRKPEIDEVVACEPFLTIELKLLRPIIVVSLGAVAFESLCPSLSFSDSLGKIVKSKFDVNVYPVYHPSPRNMADKHRKKRFEADMRVLCEMIKRLNKNGQT